MKVGIVTITLGINYGNRLQNFALQETLKKLGIESDTFYNEYQEKNIIKQIKRKIILKDKEKIFKEKLKKFKNFNDKYINFKGKIKSFYVSKNINKKYDYFICGSDQIWNPLYKGNTGTNFLTFAKKEKRIAYAPSFGISYIPDKRKNEYKKYLQDIKYLSCREYDGINLIKEISNKEATIVLDPTMLLSVEEWNKIAKKCSYIPKNKYIVTYFLGNEVDEYKEYINNIAQKKGLEIFDIMDMSNMEKFSTDPQEFIYLIKNSELICTDSFHGTVFSILYQKPFINFNRISKMENMNSRINSLYKLLNIENRYYNEIDENKIFDMDFKNILKNLNNEKIKSINYLRKALLEVK